MSKLRPADRGEAEATARGRLNWGKRGGCAVARKVCDVNPPLTNFVIVSEGRDSGDSLLCGAIECDEGGREPSQNFGLWRFRDSSHPPLSWRRQISLMREKERHRHRPTDLFEMSLFVASVVADLNSQTDSHLTPPPESGRPAAPRPSVRSPGRPAQSPTHAH